MAKQTPIPTAVNIYTGFLWLYPRAHREAYGALMVQPSGISVTTPTPAGASGACSRRGSVRSWTWSSPRFRSTFTSPPTPA